MVYVVEREVGAGVRFNPAEVGVGLIVLLFFRLFRLEGLEHPLDCLWRQFLMNFSASSGLPRILSLSARTSLYFQLRFPTNNTLQPQRWCCAILYP